MTELKYDPAQAIEFGTALCFYRLGRYAAFMVQKAHHGISIEVAFLSNTSRLTADGTIEQRPGNELVPDIIWSRFIPAHSNAEQRATTIGTAVDSSQFKEQVRSGVRDAKSFIDGTLRGLLTTLDGTMNDYRGQSVRFKKVGPVLIFENNGAV